MENNNPNYVYQNVMQMDDQASSRKFIANVFGWMFVALGVSALCAYIFANTPSLLATLVDVTTGQLTAFAYIAMFSPLLFVFLIRYGLNRISYTGLAALFVVYAALTGISLSFILLIYTSASLMGAFTGAAVMFGIMAVAGYTTNTDLTKLGSLLIMALIGIIISTVINYFFLHSDGLAMIINYIGVIVFVGLTAYDVQKLKRIGAGVEYGDATSKKYALMGGLTLYLDFINLFLFILRIFGRRR
jgi:FtsH-binding integral membrane protein